MSINTGIGLIDNDAVVCDASTSIVSDDAAYVSRPRCDGDSTNCKYQMTASVANISLSSLEMRGCSDSAVCATSDELDIQTMVMDGSCLTSTVSTTTDCGGQNKVMTTTQGALPFDTWIQSSSDMDSAILTTNPSVGLVKVDEDMKTKCINSDKSEQPDVFVSAQKTNFKNEKNNCGGQSTASSCELAITSGEGINKDVSNDNAANIKSVSVNLESVESSEDQCISNKEFSREEEFKSKIHEDLSHLTSKLNTVKIPTDNLSDINDFVTSLKNQDNDNKEVKMKNKDKIIEDQETTADVDDEKQSIYQIKWIKHKGVLMPVVTQNENGPCPLLAIMNLLLLQSKVKLPLQAEVITSNELMANLADWIFEHVPKNISEDTRLNYEQNMHDAIAVFPRLQTGLDVNVRFTGVCEFEYTPECIVFDLLDIPLYHGWLVDPQMPELTSAIGNCTYNQLVEKIIVQKNSNSQELVAQALLAEDFLNMTASQLTYHGLSELSATIKDEQMCVFFRNNHFSTLYKYKNELFVLVTDQGFLRESNVIWETLSNIEGDGHFVDAEFCTYHLPEVSDLTLHAPTFTVNSKEQIDHDYLVALSLEQEQSETSLATPTLWTESSKSVLSDHELALRLQEEENLNAGARSGENRQAKPATLPSASTAASSSNAGSGSSASKEKKETSCSVM